MPHLLEIWQNGVWLQSAPAVFTNIRAKRLKPAVPVATAALNQMAEHNPQGAAGLKMFSEGLGQLQAQLRVQSDLRERRYEQLLEKLHSGELVALGFLSDATADDPPTRIPIHLFDGRFSGLAKNLVRSEVFEFRLVKVVYASDFAALDFGVEGPSTAVKGPAEKQGGRREILLQIYDEVIASKLLLTKHTQKDVHTAVRKLALRDYPELFVGERGLDYKTFSAHLRNRLK
jgi:hypothetical protein